MEGMRRDWVAGAELGGAGSGGVRAGGSAPRSCLPGVPSSPSEATRGQRGPGFGEVLLWFPDLYEAPSCGLLNPLRESVGCSVPGLFCFIKPLLGKPTKVPGLLLRALQRQGTGGQGARPAEGTGWGGGCTPPAPLWCREESGWNL